jgi:tRNA nucleotidyltransferase (CCA-adding enzyme)
MIMKGLCSRFTMNAIARNISTNELIDPHNGRGDICARVVRCVGNPVHRFNEDKLRILRALRFAATKKMHLLWETSNAIHKFSLNSFSGVSTERIREELLKMFAANSGWAFKQLFVRFPVLGNLTLERGIWFRPTTSERA